MNLLTDILPLGKGSGDLYLIIYLNKYIAKYIRHVNIRTIGKNVENIIRIGEGLIIVLSQRLFIKNQWLPGASGFQPLYPRP